MDDSGRAGHRLLRGLSRAAAKLGGAGAAAATGVAVAPLSRTACGRLRHARGKSAARALAGYGKPGDRFRRLAYADLADLWPDMARFDCDPDCVFDWPRTSPAILLAANVRFRIARNAIARRCHRRLMHRYCA